MLRVAAGDPSALEALYDRYVRQCFGLGLRMLNDPTLAEEVVQETFMKLWTQPGSYSAQKGRFTSWLLSMVHHRCVDELRKRSRTEVPLENPETGSFLAASPDLEPGPAEAALTNEQQ